ncbi:hypothetical protein FACS1894106_0530 [Spirochaetia bacterium]|nr:hypothetical protein FACS1894106_0530 [Spirochaetia bacterium]
MNKICISFLFCLFILFGCNTQKGLVQNDPKEMKIIFYADNQREYFKNLLLLENIIFEINNNGDYVTIKNISEDKLIELHKIMHLENDIIADNIANVNTTRTENGGPYIRKYLKITAEKGIEILEDIENYPRLVYDPTHPDAIKTGELQGYVKYPNIDIVKEMTDMIAISRLYEGIMEYSRNNYKNIIW